MNIVVKLSSLLRVSRASSPVRACVTTTCTHPRFHRIVFQLLRTMATNVPGEHKPTPASIREMDGLRRAKKTEKRKAAQERHAGPCMLYVQVVGAGSRDNPPSLYVFSAFNRYLFNCGEGTQRLMMEHKLKASRLDNIFLTRMRWGNVGGLSGLMLTLRDMEIHECVVSGPPQLEEYVNAIKVFCGQLNGMKIAVRPYTESQYTDKTMTVSQVPIFAQYGADSSKRSSSSGRENLRKEPCLEDCDDTPPDSPDSGTKTARPGSPGGKGRDPSLVVAFACKLNPKKGHFLPMKAAKLGVPLGQKVVGPMIHDWKNGKSVWYEGREIFPEEVCTPNSPGPVFLVVECPSEEFIHPISSNQQLARYQTGGTEEPASLVVHMTPESILHTDQYKQWMERFPSTTQHLILNQQVNTVHNIGSHRIQTKLNLIHPDIFPQLQLYTAKEPQADLHIPNVRGECLLKFQLQPKFECQRDAIPVCDPEEFVKEAMEVPNFVEEVDKFKRFCSTDGYVLSGRVKKYPEVLFLGTGSSIPQKTRNVSGTLVNISPSQSLLLDCGEGTFGQLCRNHGDGVDEALSKMSTIFISHMHADHHTGLPSLLYEREKALTSLGLAFSPVYLVGPEELMTWLSHYHHHCEEILSHIKFIPSNFLSKGRIEPPSQQIQILIESMLKKSDLEQLETCYVRHCKNAFACSLTHQSGWKLVFSGDTMPCENLAHMGRDATLLIHEATHDDGLEEAALEKRHSTTSQAIDIGMKMKAKFIVLNHFSQRYAKIPLFSQDMDSRVGISFDHMRMQFGDFGVLPMLIPPLKALFAEEIEEMEDLRWKKELRGGRCEEAGIKRRQEEQTTNTNTGTKRLKAISGSPK